MFVYSDLASRICGDLRRETTHPAQICANVLTLSAILIPGRDVPQKGGNFVVFLTEDDRISFNLSLQWLGVGIPIRKGLQFGFWVPD
jgi:hypothetical protein